MKKSSYIIVIVLFVAALLLADVIYSHAGRVSYWVFLPDYDSATKVEGNSCSLCGYAQTELPCMVDLNTGKVSEIPLHGSAEILTDEKKKFGFMRSGRLCEGIRYYAFPDNHYADIYIQRDKVYNYSETAAKNYFCAECIDLINAVEPKNGFVFADCYDKENIKLHGLEETEEQLEIRQYRITISEKGKIQIGLKMTCCCFSRCS